jgi:protein-disulfide isomerase
MKTEIVKLTLPVSSDRDHIQGRTSAPVTLIEYGDYECPYCGQAYPIIKEVQKQLGNKLCFVFRNFPLTEIHPHAQHAAEAAKLLHYRISFGKCTITYTNISMHLMISIWKHMLIS